MCSLRETRNAIQVMQFVDAIRFIVATKLQIQFQPEGATLNLINFLELEIIEFGNASRKLADPNTYWRFVGSVIEISESVKPHSVSKYLEFASAISKVLRNVFIFYRSLMAFLESKNYKSKNTSSFLSARGVWPVTPSHTSFDSIHI